MSVGVGVIGTGVIGRDHALRIKQLVAGADVVALNSRTAEAANRLALEVGGDIRVHATATDLIADRDVDAVVVSSPGETHAEFVMEAISAGKPVFCEKPLANDARDCRAIVNAEVAGGVRLVHVGFVRRYDTAYTELKGIVSSGAIGEPLLCYSAHRNPITPVGWAGEMAVVDSAPHDFDIVRWLLGVDFSSVQAFEGKPNSYAKGLRDPLTMVLRTTGGHTVHVETSMNLGYGYDIRGEVVGERGVAALGETGLATCRSVGRTGPAIPTDWRARFSDAFDTQIRAWLATVIDRREPDGPSAWDGYMAQVVSEAAVASVRSGAQISIDPFERPAIYG
ncbi:Gfo/Idh/MocA family protein [Arthrobacter sp. KNU40]|uniref:Gfo/Idh/MocA family protein n=1 Tax=Arthrobacter sp. KNU40 TaxID=3447965 RepID=UPI003F5DD556